MSSLSLQSPDLTQRLELEYGWEMLIDRSGRLQREEAERSAEWRPARVGISWNVQFEDLRNYMGAAWYRTAFEIPIFPDTRHVLLKFGAVDYFCEVYLNGVFIGTHEGGYTPFSFEITSAVHPGANQLIIRVVDPPMDEAENRSLFPEMMYHEIPHGKQNWYVQISGIWQGVRLEFCPSIYIERLDVVPKPNGEFELMVRLAGTGLNAEAGALAGQVSLHTEIYDSNGRRVFEANQPTGTSGQNFSIQGAVRHPRLWSTDNPALYTVEATLVGAVQYRRRTRFGFRSFEAKDGKLFLNGKPFFMIAALDQDFYPETVHTPTSLESVRDMMTKAKRLGINLLRCHLKVAHPVYLDVADELGMLVWTELPSWSDCWFPSDHFSTMAAVRADKMFWEILIRDWNHPCIVLQTIINESWGINLKDAAQRQWLRTTFDRIKGLLAPLGRLVVDNSPCEGNFHLKTDIEDFHQYYSMPDQKEHWDKWLSELSNRPEWTFSPYGDAERTGQEPLLVSEFGNWGLPKLPEEFPWWLQVSFGDREVTRPEGVLTRFRDYGLASIFGSFNELAEETQWHQYSSLKYEIESIRSSGSLNGYVITGITDVHWEANGLLDMWRNEKAYAKELESLQTEDLVLCRMPKFCFQGGEQVSIPTLISHFGEANLRGARVRWSLESGLAGQFAIDTDCKAGDVSSLQAINLQLPAVDTPRRLRLDIEVRLTSGHRITENSYDLFVLPLSEHHGAAIGLHGDWSQTRRQALKDAGYGINGELGARESLVISSEYDATVGEHLQRGGHVLLLADSETAVATDWPLRIVKRAGSELDGRWFSNFNWIRPDCEPFSSVAFSKILGFESAGVAPQYVIQGLGAADFEDVLSGVTFGWLRKNSALAVQMQVGAGHMIITTYDFSKYGSDAYATRLLDAMIRYVCSAGCEPKLEMALSGAI
jgi:hypothetical protein